MRTAPTHTLGFLLNFLIRRFENTLREVERKMFFRLLYPLCNIRDTFRNELLGIRVRWFCSFTPFTIASMFCKDVSRHDLSHQLVSSRICIL